MGGVKKIREEFTLGVKRLPVVGPGGCHGATRKQGGGG